MTLYHQSEQVKGGIILVMGMGNPRVFSHLPLPLPDANLYPFHG